MRAVPGAEDPYKTTSVPAVPDRQRTGSIGSTSLAESLTIGILLSDADGVVKSSNSVARRVFGVNDGKLEGARITELFEAKDAEGLATLVADILKAQKPRELELTALSKRGALNVRVAAKGRMDGAKLKEIVWSIREAPKDPGLDVTVESSKIDALAELGLELGREVGPLAAGMAKALTDAQRVLEPGGAPPDAQALRSSIADAMSGIVRLQEVVSELERFAADTPLKIAPVDPSEILGRAETLLQRSLKALRVKVRNDIDEPAPKVMADASRLTEIFVNLLRNGRNAITRRFEGDAQGLDSSGNPVAKRLIVVESYVKDPYVSILVSNNGLAVPAEDVEKIFVPTLGVKGAKKMGMGLPQTAALMREMGGAVRCQPLGEVGTRFILTFRKV
jgi:nitrogen-specific signal transduction histidine kinase